ncbi:hypothetical protein AK812_SmicGene17710 [Symbiodinium microadriaticum]|uniref:Uncharacterized protein n=1 Tax=Symbiodinium microadriaticum TaxID=2951 RepID=A0A1Q9DX01_SYMMI|nr:hypothetical protein AK812_SmicGene17710 [Symbiodinium microadriaticum]
MGMTAYVGIPAKWFVTPTLLLLGPLATYIVLLELQSRIWMGVGLLGRSVDVVLIAVAFHLQGFSPALIRTHNRKEEGFLTWSCERRSCELPAEFQTEMVTSRVLQCLSTGLFNESDEEEEEEEEDGGNDDGEEDHGNNVVMTVTMATMMMGMLTKKMISVMAASAGFRQEEEG